MLSNHHSKLFLLISLYTYATPAQSAQMAKGIKAAPVKTPAQQAARALQAVLPPPGLPRLVVSFLYSKEKTIKALKTTVMPFNPPPPFPSSGQPTRYCVTPIASARIISAGPLENELELIADPSADQKLYQHYFFRGRETLKFPKNVNIFDHIQHSALSIHEPRHPTIEHCFEFHPHDLDAESLQKALTLLEKS